MTENWLTDLVDKSPLKRHVAWAGELEFRSATESDRIGRTVQFTLRRQPKDLGTAHPFSAHTRRRRGRAGTMFTMSLDPIGPGQAFVGGAMLLNWSASPKGETVTFLLNFEPERHPFLGCTRPAKGVEASRWMAVFVEEDDQSAPVDQHDRDAFSALCPDPAIEGQSVCMVCRKSPAERCICDVPAKRKPKQQIKNSNLARIFTKSERFWKFLSEVHGFIATDEHSADDALKALLAIDSKADLDRGMKAAEFEDLRIEYVDWQEETFGPLT
jgi:hypothetical protein